MTKKNTKVIRVDTEKFLPAFERFKKKNDIGSDPLGTRELGKLLDSMATESNFNIRRKIRF